MAEDTLEGFLEANPQTTGMQECFICSLPPEIRQQIERVVKTSKHPRWKAISAWLATRGYEATNSRISRHFERKHDER